MPQAQPRQANRPAARPPLHRLLTPSLPYYLLQAGGAERGRDCGAHRAPQRAVLRCQQGGRARLDANLVRARHAVGAANERD
jgi:hypothetical protein